MNFEIRKLTEAEESLFGVFVSHSNVKSDCRILENLADDFKERKINLVYDKKFLSPGNDFRKMIRRYATGNAAIVLLTPNSIGSMWVNYEIGMLRARNIPIFIYDPYKMLSNNIFARVFSPYKNDNQIKQFLSTTFTNKNELIEAVCKLPTYRGIYPAESNLLPFDDFNRIFNENVEKCMLSVTSSVFDRNREWFERAKIGILIIHFGQMNDWTAPCKYATNGICNGLNNRKIQCALQKLTRDDTLADLEDESKRICTVLNNVIYTGNILYSGDINIYDKDAESTISTAVLRVNLPVHKKYGVKFKLIFDVESIEAQTHVYQALNEIDLNPSLSNSDGNNRVYCSINASVEDGLFVIDTSYNDNFMCPKALEK